MMMKQREEKESRCCRAEMLVGGQDCARLQGLLWRRQAMPYLKTCNLAWSGLVGGVTANDRKIMNPAGGAALLRDYYTPFAEELRRTSNWELWNMPISNQVYSTIEADNQNGRSILLICCVAVDWPLWGNWQRLMNWTLSNPKVVKNMCGEMVVAERAFSGWHRGCK